MELLFIAENNNYIEIVELLLKQEDIDADIMNHILYQKHSWYSTLKFSIVLKIWTFNSNAFICAAANGHKDIAELLFKQRVIDINIKSILNQKIIHKIQIQLFYNVEFMNVFWS